LIGVIHGASAIPPRFTLGLWNPVWTEAFNDTYINFTRDGLPAYNRISDIVNRILQLAEEAIISTGGQKIFENGEAYYLINSDI
jgi:hypothetical protein